MDELSELLRTATAHVEQPYFMLNIAGGAPVLRERVYCYELYHQMRKAWPSDCKFFLNGEIDKRAHPVLRDLDADHVKPDLLVHIPGDMNGNYAIIEIKHSTAAAGIRKDLETLCLFVRKVGYRRAIYLIFGPEANEDAIARINAVATEFPDLVPIEVWLHPNAGQPAENVAVISRGEDLWVRTEYDGKDLRQVTEIYYYDYEGEEAIHLEATEKCYNLTTCADMGDDTWETLRELVERNLRAAGIAYASVTMDTDY